MTTKLKIDLTQGILEVEGSETFVKGIYRDFKIQFLGEEAGGEETGATRRTRRRRRTKPAAKEEAAAPVEISEAAEPAPQPKISSTPSPYTYLKDLDLQAGEDQPALVEFMDSKLPITNEERNLVFLYYLQHLRQLELITFDHIYTCYRSVRIRAPFNLEASLKSAQNRIEIGEEGQIRLTAAGKSYVEQELPKKAKT